jgi:PhzF family phenazine biosynthesis protein
MKLALYQVDAFTDRVFGGNPAAIVPLSAWIEPALMQAIAAENNLAETAFFVESEPGRYRLRWFTPTSEIDLCGHATLASAYVIFHFLAPEQKELRFETRSGELCVMRQDDGGFAMALPAAASEPFTAPSGFAQKLAKALNTALPQELHLAEKGGGGARTLIALFASAAAIRALKPSADLETILLEVDAKSLVATAIGDRPYDFVSRFFAPALGVAEDPVTGSAHSALVPFWARRLGSSKLKARQLSPRGGDLLCTDDGARVILEGACALYLSGEIDI